MGMISEFKEFISRGNVVDLAVGVVIGAAFGKIVTVLVDRVLMPPIGLALGGVDFTDWAITLKAASLATRGPGPACRKSRAGVIAIGVWPARRAWLSAP